MKLSYAHAKQPCTDPSYLVYHNESQNAYLDKKKIKGATQAEMNGVIEYKQRVWHGWERRAELIVGAQRWRSRPCCGWPKASWGIPR